MNTRITVKKVGNHWYPDIQHEFADEIELDEKVERVLNFLDKNHFGELEFYIYEQDDILRYMITDDDFDIRIYIRGHEFLISSDLYYLLELQFNFDFQNNYYKIELY